MAYLRQQGVDTAIVRIFNTFGPRMRPNDGRATRLHGPGARRPAGHGLRRRSRRAASVTSTTSSAAWCCSPSPRFTTREHREPERDVAARHGELIIELTESRSRSSSRRSPWTTRRCASPTSPARATCSGAGDRRARIARTIKHYTRSSASRVAMSSAEAKNLEDPAGHRPAQRLMRVAGRGGRDEPFEVERLGWDSIRASDSPESRPRHRLLPVVCAREDGLPAEEESVEAVADQTVPVELDASPLNLDDCPSSFSPGLLFFGFCRYISRSRDRRRDAERAPYRPHPNSSPRPSGGRPRRSGSRRVPRAPNRALTRPRTCSWCPILPADSSLERSTRAW